MILTCIWDEHVSVFIPACMFLKKVNNKNNVLFFLFFKAIFSTICNKYLFSKILIKTQYKILINNELAICHNKVHVTCHITYIKKRYLCSPNN